MCGIDSVGLCVLVYAFVHVFECIASAATLKGAWVLDVYLSMPLALPAAASDQNIWS
jgi:hypothetical protein